DTRVLVRGQGVERVLQAGRDDDLVHQRVAQPGHLYPVVSRTVGGRLTGDAHPGPVGGRPDPDVRVALRVAAQRHVLERHLQRDRVHVVPGQRVLADLAQVAAVQQV